MSHLRQIINLTLFDISLGEADDQSTTGDESGTDQRTAVKITTDGRKASEEVVRDRQPRYRTDGTDMSLEQRGERDRVHAIHEDTPTYEKSTALRTARRQYYTGEKLRHDTLTGREYNTEQTAEDGLARALPADQPGK